MTSQTGGMRAWIDGACRGNPGEAGFGVVAEAGDGEEQLGGFLGRTTNNVAEYAALVAALSWAGRRGVERLELFSDSQLLVRQLNGAYRVKAPHLVPIFLKVLELRRALERLDAKHLPREENRHADKLANLAIDQRTAPPRWLELELPAR